MSPNFFEPYLSINIQYHIFNYIFLLSGIGSFFQKSEKQNCSENESRGESSSNQPTSKDTENDKVISLDAEHSEKTENTSDKENEQQTNSSDTNMDVNENELPLSKKPSGKQKACVSGKALKGTTSSSKKKRRVVLEDSSDEE